MNLNITIWARLGLVAICAATAGCGVDDLTVEGQDGAGSSEDAIIGGSPATGFPEAALVSFNRGNQGFICSGAVIAPQVVLTAGHCVAGGSQFAVKAPFANGQASSAVSAATFDYTEVSEIVDPNAHDVGLIFLASPIQLAKYPTIASREAPRGSRVVNIGRIDNGVNSDSALFVSRPLTVSAAGAQVARVENAPETSRDEHKDSNNGPDMIAGTHTVVSVNSGTLGDGREVLARVDLVKSFIDDQIARHGGPGGATPTPPDPGNQAQNPNPGGGGGVGSFCYSLACSGGTTGQKCFASESAYRSSLCSEQTCGGSASQLCAVFCN